MEPGIETIQTFIWTRNLRLSAVSSLFSPLMEKLMTHSPAHRHILSNVLSDMSSYKPKTKVILNQQMTLLSKLLYYVVIFWVLLLQSSVIQLPMQRHYVPTVIWRHIPWAGILTILWGNFSSNLPLFGDSEADNVFKNTFLIRMVQRNLIYFFGNVNFLQLRS